MATPSNKHMVEDLLQTFSNLTRNPERFLWGDDDAAKEFLLATKKTYDLGQGLPSRITHTKESSLPELIIDNFDDEQVWQEIELENDSFIPDTLITVHKLRSGVPSTFCRKRAAVEKAKNINCNVQESDYGQVKLAKSDDIADEDEEEFGDGSENEEGDSDSDLEKRIKDIKNRLHTNDSEEGSDDDNDFDFDLGGMGGESGSDNQSEDDDAENEEQFDMIREVTRGKQSSKTSSKKQKSSIVDDKFFKLAEMETFLEQEDAKEMKKHKEAEEEDEESDEEEEEDMDMFTNQPFDTNEDTAASAHYSDFFDPPDGETEEIETDDKLEDEDEEEGEDEDEDDDEDEVEDEDEEHGLSKRVRFKDSKNLLDDSDSGEDVTDILGGAKNKESNFEKRQKKLSKKISEMEEASIKPNSWQMSGEISGKMRPENSLLEEHVTFEQTTRLAPVITQTTTENLESLIRQRIKDQAFDDVQRKHKPKDEGFEYRKRITLDQEKSKKSLGEIYEEEYLKQQKEEEEDQEEPDHTEIKKQLKDLYMKLDALSHFHYTPKPPAPDVKITTNLPSIAMEEVAPVSVSDHTLLAPEEIKEKQKGELMSKTEKSDTDRKRERRKKKRMKKLKRLDRERKLKEKAGSEKALINQKKEALEQLKKTSKSNKSVKIIKSNAKGDNLTSSKTFFTKLQEDVVSQIKQKTQMKAAKNKKSDVSSKKFKL